MTTRSAAPWLLAALLLLASVLPTTAQCVDHERSLQLAATRVRAGAVADMARLGTLVLLGVEDVGLTVYDLDNPEIPWFIDEHVLGAGEWRVAAAGDAAVMMRADSDTLQCLDMTIAASPRTAGGLSLPGWTIDSAASATHVYVLCDTDAGGASRALVTVDVSDPDAPLITDTRALPDQSAALDIRGAVLAAAGPLIPNLTLYDLAAPQAPLSFYSWHGGGLVRDVSLADDRAWLAGNGALYAVDISLTTADHWSHPDPGSWTGVAVDGDRLHLLGDASDDGLGYEVFDISTATPALIGSSAMTGDDISADGDWSFLARGDEGFATVAAVDPRPVPPLGTVAPETSFDDVVGVAADQGVAAALLETRTAGGSVTGRVWISDVSDPTAPVRRSAVDVPGDPRGVAMGGDLIAVISYVAGLDRAQLALIDITDPALPVQGPTVTMSGDPRALFVRDGHVHVFIASTDLGTSSHLEIVRAVDPLSPGVVYNAFLPAAPRALAISGDTMVLAMDGIVDLYSYAGSVTPLLVDTWNVSTNYTSLALDGVRLFLGGEGYVLTADLETPGELDLHTSIALPGPCRALAIDGDVLYAAAGDLVAVDVADLGTPLWLGMVGPGAGAGVALTPVAVAAAAGPRGLEMLRLHCDGGVGVEDPPPGRQDGDLPPRSRLLAPMPNPFNPSVQVAFDLARPGHVLVTVHDVAGGLIATLADDARTAGRHTLDWHGRSDRGREMPAGVYLVRLSTDDGRHARKVSLIR